MSDLYMPFDGTNAPAPMDPITDPTPAERKELEEKQRLEQQSIKDTKLKAEAEEQKKTGLFGKLTSVAADVANTAQKTAVEAASTVQKKAFQLVDDHTAKRFAVAFPQLATERILGDFSCKVISNGGPQPTISGYLDITPAHICFIGDNKLNFFFSIADIVSIQNAVTLPTEKGTQFVLTVPDPLVIPTALQVFTKQGQQHVFGFLQTPKDALNVMDHAWRGFGK